MSPAMTRMRQGWMLLPLALRAASLRSRSTVARSTGVGRNARTDWRVVMASSTAAAALGDFSCIGQTQCLHALGDFAEEQPLHVVITEQLLRAAFDRDLAEMHDIAAIGDREGMRGLLLDHDDREALIAQRQQLLE